MTVVTEAAPVVEATPPAAPAAVEAPAGAPPAAEPPADGPAPAPSEPPAPILGQPTDKPFSEVLPEKFRVKKPDGTLDVEASALKSEAARAALEARIGTGDMRPKTADDYKLVVPPEMQKLADAALADPAGVKAFQAKVFAAGLTQAQYEFVLREYLTVAPSLVAGAKSVDVNAAVAELKKDWPVDADFQTNVGRANKAIRAYGGPDIKGIFDDYGSDPRIVRMMARIGAEVGEDQSPKNIGGADGGAGDVKALERSEAYRNPKHADHERVSAQIRDFYQRTAGGATT